jgi:hypothetical protein
MHRVLCAGLCALIAAGLCLAPAGGQPPRPMPGVVFVANGSGDSTLLTENLEEMIDLYRAPLVVRTVCWTTGDGARADHINLPNQRRWGVHMAWQITALKRTHPHACVYLMGHSSGCHVVLAAAEALPPGTVERVVLLAPSVSSRYDLRRALRATTRGIDVYYSSEDAVLDTVQDTTGTADGLHGVTAAGIVGFCKPPAHFPDAHLYQFVRPFPWTPAMERSGNHGGHAGCARMAFLRDQVVPCMLGP